VNDPWVLALGGRCRHQDWHVEPTGVYCTDCGEQVGGPAEAEGLMFNFEIDRLFDEACRDDLRQTEVK